MEHGISLPCSQDPPTGPYPKLEESISHLHNLFLSFILILSAHIEVKSCPCALTEPHAMKAYGWRHSSTHSLTLALDGGEWSGSRPDRFTPRERAPGTHWIGGWVGPRAVLDTVVKRKIPSPCQESNRTPIVQPVAQRYTD
jgi:hypothetical protein